MCGIFGIAAGPGTPLSRSALDEAVAFLFKRSEERGKEAAGMAALAGGRIDVFKHAQRASHMLRTKGWKAYWSGLGQTLYAADPARPAVPFALVGHSRLVTNGIETTGENNQPVVAPHAVGVHNGIIVNVNDLWRRHPAVTRRYEVDSEAIFTLAPHLGQGDVVVGLQKFFSEMEGSASIGLLSDDGRTLVLASNTGSLHVARAEAAGLLVFASERHTLELLLAQTALAPLAKHVELAQVAAGTGLKVDIGTAAVQPFRLDEPLPAKGEGHPSLVSILDRSANLSHLRRCTRCVLPETFPFITFDEHGVCSVCRSYEWKKAQGRAALEQAVEKYRRAHGPDCLVAFSGGRDSGYVLHYMKRELGMNPVAFTYDWGMVTDVGRRNQARFVGKLGVEHVIRSPDIRAKRRYIRENLKAWLKRPDLGMVPLFSAGDKQFYHYGRELRKEMGIDLTVFGAGNELERTEFKTGFCGVRENQHGMRLNAMTVANKAQFLWYYAKQYLLNWRYINSSLLDIAASYWSTYVAKDDFLYLFHYVEWDEDEIMRVLTDEYGWETAPDTHTTWRIDDAFTPFHNYIYHTVAGFTEHDTFRSNQIRRGLIGRDKALTLVVEENRPRIQAMREYAEMIGVNLEEVMLVINSIPKLYER